VNKWYTLNYNQNTQVSKNIFTALSVNVKWKMSIINKTMLHSKT